MCTAPVLKRARALHNHVLRCHPRQPRRVPAAPPKAELPRGRLHGLTGRHGPRHLLPDALAPGLELRRHARGAGRGGGRLLHGPRAREPVLRRLLDEARLPQNTRFCALPHRARRAAVHARLERALARVRAADPGLRLRHAGRDARVLRRERAAGPAHGLARARDGGAVLRPHVHVVPRQPASADGRAARKRRVPRVAQHLSFDVLRLRGAAHGPRRPALAPGPELLRLRAGGPPGGCDRGARGRRPDGRRSSAL